MVALRELVADGAVDRRRVATALGEEPDRPDSGMSRAANAPDPFTRYPQQMSVGFSLLQLGIADRQFFEHCSFARRLGSVDI